MCPEGYRTIYSINVAIRTRDYYGYLVGMDVLWRLNAFVCSRVSSC